MENRRFFASFWHLLKPMLGALVLCFVVSNAFAKSCDDDGGEYLDLTTNQCVSCAAGTGFGNTYVGFVCPGEPYYNIQACAENEIPYFQYGTRCLNSTSASTIYGAVIKSSLAAGKYITPDGTVADCDDTAFANLFGTTGVSNRYFYFYGLDGKPYNYGNKSDVGCLGKTNILYIPSSTGLHTQYYAKGLTKCPAEHYAYANLNYKICEPTGTAAWQTDNYTCSAGQYIPQGYRSCQSCTSIPASSPYGCAQSFSTGKSSINEGSGASSDIFASSANRCATGYKWKNNQRKQCIKCAEGYSYNNSYVCSHETPDSDTGTIGDIGNIGNIGNIPVGTLPVTSGTTTFLCDNGSSSSLSWSNSSLTFPTISSKCSTPSTDKRTLWLCAKGVSGNNGEQYYIWKTQKQGTTAASNDLSGLAGAMCAPAMPMKVYWPTQNDTPAEFYAVYIAQSGALAIVNMVDANTYWGWGQVINYVPTNWYSVSTLADYVNSFSGYFDVTRIRDTPRGESHTITETNATAFANALKNQYQYLNNWGISLRVGPKMSLTCPDNTVKSVVYTKTTINQTDINNLLAQCTTTYSGNDKELLCHDGNSNNYAQVSGDNSLCFWPFIPSSKSAKSTSGGFYCETYVCKTNIVHCDAGTYLPANSSTCSACSTGYYCTGGDFIESSEPQGKYACADTSANGGTDGVYPTTWSGTNYSAKTACLAKITFHGNGGQATRDDTGVSGTDWTVGAKYVNSSSYSNSCNLGSARLCKSSDTNYRITDGVTLGSNNKLQTQWQRSGHDFAGWWYKNANVTANECTSISGTYDATAETCTTNGSCPSDWTKIENECVPDTKLTQVTATTDLTGSRSLYAKWTIKCAAGTYLPANSTTCQPCPAVSSGQGYYCLGGDFETSTTDQGLSNCPPGYPWSAQGNSSITTCYITMSFYPSKDAVFRTATYNTDNSYNNLTNVYKQSNYWFALVSNTDGTKHMAATLLAGGNTAPTKTGYTFDGWMWQLQNVNPSECTAAGMTSSCADVSTCNNASKRGCNLGSLTSCPSGWSFYGGLCIPDSKLTAVTASTNIISGSQRNFYAKWTQIQYTVQYDCGLGSGTAPANGTANYNQTFTPAANTCTKDGYTFTGWKVSGTEDIKTPNVGFTWGYQASKTFTAQWQPIQYTVSFNANGGTGTKSSVTCTYGVDCDIANKSNEFRKTGLTWVGWKSSNNNSYGSTISEPYMADLVENNGVYTMTLTAQWANNGGSCNPGYYYSAASQGCVECVSSTEDGYYCPGGIHTGGNTDQLRNTCPTGWDHSFVELNNGSNNVTRPSKPGHCFKIETTTCDVASPFSDPHGTVTYTSAGTNTVNCRNFYGSNTCQLIDSRECNVSLTCDTGYTKTINNVLYDYYATAGNTYTYDDTSINQTWTATFDYGVVTGESRLSLTEPAGSGTIYVRQYPTPVIEKSPYDTVPQAALCWCKTNTFTPTDGSIQNAESMWFPYAYLTYATQSTTTCPKVCGANVISSSGNGFRQGLFGTPPYCKVNTYAITYYYLYDSQMPIDSVTGTTLTNPTSYTIETETFTLYNPIREGYEFAGWCTGSANCASPQQTVTITQGTTGNKVYYAKWTATTYSIEYNTEGGVCSGGTTPENHNCSPTQYLITSANITLPSPTQSEHVFDGWCVYGPSDTDNGTNCTSTNYVAAGQVAIPNGSTGNKTVYAKWNPAVYDVILDDQSGSGGSGHAYEKYGTGWYSNSTATTAFSPANTVVAPTRSGYTFRGYYSSQVEDVEDFDDSGTQVITKSGLLPDNETYDDSNTNANNEVTLYAAWARNCNPGAQASCTLNVTDAGVVTYTTSCSAGYEISNDGQYNPQCTPIDYSITYNATGGWCTGGNLITNNCSPTSYNVESAAITLPTPTRTGYIFAGWYDNSALIGTADTTISAGSTGDKEYWAKWTPNVLDLNWYAVIGDATPYTTNVCTYDSDITLPSTNPSRTGYTFTGWAVD